jgi:methylmalonyl-CoA mutase N-terminal domain/subunit
VFPYTRGIHPSGYRGKLWTMRQFAGFGTPEETNGATRRCSPPAARAERRVRPADADGPRPGSSAVARRSGEVRRQRDVARRHGALFDGITLATITTSMTINSPAPMIFAMYLVVAEQQGADWTTLSGTIQNDILKEFIAQKEYIFPPRRRCGSSPTSSRSARKKCRAGTRSR